MYSLQILNAYMRSNAVQSECYIVQQSINILKLPWVFIKVHLDRLSYHWKQKALWGRREKYTTIMSTFMLTGTY